MSNDTILLNSTRCHSLLLNMSINYPSIFRDPPLKSSLVYGLCPETYFPLVVSSTTLFCYLLIFSIGLVGLLWYRSKPHIQARGLYLILANMLANLSLVFLMTMRVIVGKRDWPCFLLSLTFMLSPPLFTLPSILRGCRLFFLYRLNLKKKKLYGSNPTDQVHTSSTSNLDIGSNSFHGIPSNSFGAISVVSSSADESVFVETEQQENISQKDHKLMKTFEFLASNRFFVIVYIIAVVIHMILYAIVGGIELGVFNSTSVWLFVESGFFESAHGCAINSKILIVFGIQAAFYILTFLVINLLCILSDRDTFNIKLEELILNVSLAIIFIAYCILGSIPEVTNLVDYFVPYAHVFIIYSFLEMFIGVILPISYSIRDLKKQSNNNQENQMNNQIEKLLNEKKALEIISDFARRSYCIEDVLAWKEIQKFKKMKNRKQAALEFVKNFLISGSPLELNLPNGGKLVKALQEKLDTGEEPPANLFEDLEFQCLFNMVDMLQRLKTRNEYIAKQLED